MSEGEVRFRVLTVCTGNICRSPAAERLIRHVWADGEPTIEVTSGGTEAMVGEPIQISMAHLLEQSGAYSGEFCARLLNGDLVRGSDLVLGMTRRHRAAAVSFDPGISARAFTLREFARLIADGSGDFTPGPDRAEALRRLVEVAASRRRPVLDPEQDDIADPYGRDLEAYHVAFAQISEAVHAVGRILDGLPVPERAPVVPSLAEPESSQARGWRGWSRRR